MMEDFFFTFVYASYNYRTRYSNDILTISTRPDVVVTMKSRSKPLEVIL